LGIPIILAFLWIIFSLTFSLGQYPTSWLESGINYLSGVTASILPPGDLKSLIVDGIIGGVGGVLIFLPNILILFFFLSFLEDTGYMARAAFIMDKVMHRIGLHGKSFIPLIMGFGCNVPAIMSTRIIESRNNRLLTMLILPFMSCSARLPVFILIISALFPGNHGTWLFAAYLTGILLAVITALIFRRLIFRKEESPFVMELPPYRLPALRNTSRHMWHKSAQYLKKIGSVILIASIIIWGLGYYPVESSLFNGGQTEETSQLNSPQDNKGSYLEQIGVALEPVMQPLGFDWKMTIGLLAGIPGKEIVVSTLAVLYQDDDTVSLPGKIRKEKELDALAAGNPDLPLLAGISYMLFVLVYFPCIAVIATVAKESGHIKWALFMIAYTTLLAWLLSFSAFNIGNILI
jgi:ferrous iron transport protein B